MADAEKIKALEEKLKKLREAQVQNINVRILAYNIEKLIEAEKKR
jgi:hypothetical protein